jgi:hypothetical protein
MLFALIITCFNDDARANDLASMIFCVSGIRIESVDIDSISSLETEMGIEIEVSGVLSCSIACLCAKSNE